MAEQQTIQDAAPVALATHLVQLVQGGCLGHAYIFAGRDALGQAWALAQTLLCTESKEGQACGACASCHKVTHLMHADCHLLRPEKGVHRIETMRRMQAEAYLKAYEGGRKIFIIEGAELLLEEAANSLLKLLEEPPADTVFLLVCANPDRLLPTIKSRCQLFLFGADNSIILDEGLVQQYLPSARAFLQKLPRLALWQALLEARNEDLDRDGWLHYLCALWRLLAAAVKGQEEFAFSPDKALKAALLMENSLDLLRRNINQKLLMDIVFIRLWQYVEKA